MLQIYYQFIGENTLPNPNRYVSFPPKIFFPLQKVIRISDTNLKPPNMEKCFKMSSRVDQQ